MHWLLLLQALSRKQERKGPDYYTFVDEPNPQGRQQLIKQRDYHRFWRSDTPQVKNPWLKDSIPLVDFFPYLVLQPRIPTFLRIGLTALQDFLYLIFDISTTGFLTSLLKKALTSISVGVELVVFAFEPSLLRQNPRILRTSSQDFPNIVSKSCLQCLDVQDSYLALEVKKTMLESNQWIEAQLLPLADWLLKVLRRRCGLKNVTPTHSRFHSFQEKKILLLECHFSLRPIVSI